jgi:hypothetical protein
MSYEVFLQKYKNFNPEIVLLDEFKVDVYENIKPTAIPGIDFCMIKMVGDVYNELIKYTKWQRSKDIKQDIITFTFNNYPLLPINIKDINDIIEESRNKNEDPSTLNIKLDKAIKINIADFLANTNNEEGHKLLMDTYYKYHNNFPEVMIKHKLEWKEIEDEFKEIEKLIFKIFEPYIEDPNFIDTFQIIEDISNETKIKIEKLSKRILLDFQNDNNNNNNNNKNNNNNENPNPNLNQNDNYNDNDKFNHFLGIFETEMNKIYETSVKSRNFENQITDMLLAVYGPDKEIYKISLTIDFTNNLLTKIH